MGVGKHLKMWKDWALSFGMAEGSGTARVGVGLRGLEIREDKMKAITSKMKTITRGLCVAVVTMALLGGAAVTANAQWRAHVRPRVGFGVGFGRPYAYGYAPYAYAPYGYSPYYVDPYGYYPYGYGFGLGFGYGGGGYYGGRGFGGRGFGGRGFAGGGRGFGGGGRGFAGGGRGFSGGGRGFGGGGHGFGGGGHGGGGHR
jgi:hypothetical protein